MKKKRNRYIKRKRRLEELEYWSIGVLEWWKRKTSKVFPNL
jgi:hypothetical protein